MSAVLVSFAVGVLVGALATRLAALARIRDLQAQQDEERATWRHFDRLRHESDRIAYGIGQATVIGRPRVLAMRPHQGERNA